MVQQVAVNGDPELKRGLGCRGERGWECFRGLFFLFFFLMFIRVRERERERVSRGGAERGDRGYLVGSALTVETDVGLELMNHEIMT